MKTQFNELYESMMLEATFKPIKKGALKQGEKLPTREENLQWYAEPEKDGYGIYIKSSGKFYKVTWLPANDIDEALIAVNKWMESKGKDFSDLIKRYLDKNYKLNLTESVITESEFKVLKFFKNTKVQDMIDILKTYEDNTNDIKRNSKGNYDITIYEK